MNSCPVIAHVLHRLYLAGAEVLAADLARRLGHPGDPGGPGDGEARYRFVFLCLDEVGPLGEELRREGFTVIDLRRKPGVDFSVARRLAGAVREHGIDLLHAHQYTPFFYAALSRLPPASWMGRGPRILFTEHGRHYPDFRRPKRVWANKALFRRRDRITAVGQWVKQCLVDNEGLPAGRIEVVYNGIDPGKFGGEDTPAKDSLKAELRTKMRAELGLTATQPVVLQVARFHPVKDHETALRAFALVAEESGPRKRSEVRGQEEGEAAQTEQRAAVGGQGSGERPVLLLAGDGDERDKMEALARELGVAEQVRFLGARGDVARLLAAADVFLLSSLSEGVSVTLLEAMGAGLPIAATNVGGNGEVVADGVTGLLSPRRDPRKLADNLLALLRDPALRQRLGAAGRQRLLEKFTQARMHARYAAIYGEMLRSA